MRDTEELDKIRLWFEQTRLNADLAFKRALADHRTKEEQVPEARQLAGMIFGLLTIAWLFQSVRKPGTVRPPFNAEYLLHLFLKREEREVVIGDLVESYNQVARRFGKRRADFWFYKQVAGSLWPLFRRAAVKLGTFVWLGRFLRRLIS